jgi:hypothetical protein
MPKELRSGINPRINNVERRIDEENKLRDIEIKRHEEMIWDLYQRAAK